MTAIWQSVCDQSRSKILNECIMVLKQQYRANRRPHCKACQNYLCRRELLESDRNMTVFHIIGAGVSGLTLAYELAKGGAQVRIYEKLGLPVD